jgi:sulfide:quinone oxidoreductase
VASVVIIGAGFAGHTAALYLGDELGKKHKVTVVNKYDYFGYVPSWVWVGVGTMDADKTTFKLAPVYKKKHVAFVHGAATEVHPDEQYVIAEPENGSDPVRLDYDYLVIATGPKLDFAATEGLGPHGGYTYSICTLDHATQARDAYLASVEKMEQGENQTLVIGTGHPLATCQGAAFEYITNIHKDLVRRKVRDRAELVWLSNEQAIGDFGVRGVRVKRKGELVTSEDFISALFKEYDITPMVQRGVTKVEPGVIHWEDFEGNLGETEFDYSMLVPKFSGVSLRYIGADGEDVSDKIVNAAGFVLVDGIYGLPYDELEHSPEAWPARYQSRAYPNIFAAGISFAPPGPISKPHVTPNGTAITSAPPRTGMVSGIIGRVVAKNVAQMITKGRMTHHESMTEMPAACIASMGDSLWDGSAATIIIHPVVPDKTKYPNEDGRDLQVNHMEMGLSGAWMKRVVHHTFLHKLRARPGWKIIPE